MEASEEINSCLAEIRKWRELMFALAHGKPPTRHGRETYASRQAAEAAITSQLRKKFPDIRPLTASYVDAKRQRAVAVEAPRAGLAEQVLDHLISDGQIEIGQEAQRLGTDERAVRRALERLRERGQDARPIGRRVFALKGSMKERRQKRG